MPISYGRIIKIMNNQSEDYLMPKIIHFVLPWGYKYWKFELGTVWRHYLQWVRAIDYFGVQNKTLILEK